MLGTFLMFFHDAMCVYFTQSQNNTTSWASDIRIKLIYLVLINSNHLCEDQSEIPKSSFCLCLLTADKFEGTLSKSYCRLKLTDIDSKAELLITKLDVHLKCDALPQNWEQMTFWVK